MVEARGVLITTVIAALALIGLLGFAAYRFSPSAIEQRACQSGQSSAFTDCDR